ncbi:MAG: copper chaperone PCu(A)C [Acidobacteriota bacterium]
MPLRLLGLLATVVALGCSGPEGGSTQPTAADAGVTDVAETEAVASSGLPVLDVVDPRAQLMPGMGAVYLRLVNSGAAGDRLVSIETPVARVVETHESIEDNGVMRMVEHPKGFEIPAGGAVDLEPGGKHAMLIDPQPEIDGESIPLTLHFETSASIEVAAKIMTLDAMAHQAGGHAEHGGHTEHGGQSEHGQAPSGHDATAHEAVEH